jgi:hypothetical protein
MRHALFALLLALALIGPASAQTPVRQPDLRAANVRITASQLNGAAQVALNNAQGTLSWTVTGLTASGAVLTPQVSGDGGSSWAASPVVAVNGTAQLSTISADGQYRMDVAGRTNAQLLVTTPGVGQIIVAWSATAVSPGVVPLPLPAGYAPLQSLATEGDHTFAIGQHNLYGFSVTIGSAAGYIMIFDSATVPADGVLDGVIQPKPKKCYPVLSNGTFGNGSGAWPPGEHLAFSTGIVFVFSTTGCFVKTESATAFFAAEVQ